MRTVHGVSGLAALAAMVTLAGGAGADTFAATRSDQLVETNHTVSITLRRDHALLEVERTVHNGGERPDQALFHIFPGPSAVAVGLKTLGTLNGEPHWFEGELLEAELAARRYRELTGIGGYYPKDPALLSWRAPGHLALQVFPCMPGEDKKVAYRMIVPMGYDNGRYVLHLDPMGTEKVAARATVRADGGSVRGSGKAKSLLLDKALRLEQVVPFSGPVEGELAALPFAPARVLAGFHFDVSPRLSQVPSRARLVILIDASRSMSREERDASLAAASSYLSHFTSSGVQTRVVAFSRTLAQITDGWQSAATARRRLGSTTIVARNGSEVGLALRHAAWLLADTPEGVDKRVLLLTDTRTRDALRPADLRRVLPEGTILHLGRVAPGAPQLTRDDRDRWAKLPRSTGGVLWDAAANRNPKHAAAQRALFEEWARPLRLDRVVLHAPGLTIDDVPSSLGEGEGVERHAITRRYVPFIALTAELWSQPVRRRLEPDRGYGKRRAALVFGSDLAHELSEPEMMTLALYGRAVSPVTSYLAIEPGVRPSTEGLEAAESLGLSGIGQGGGGRGVGIGLGAPGILGNLEELLRKQLLRPARACGVTSATVLVESTLREVVEITATVERDDAQHRRSRCLREAGWALDLPEVFAALEHRTTRVRL
jgi:Mg-chelatase subunit ChlD